MAVQTPLSQFCFYLVVAALLVGTIVSCFGKRIGINDVIRCSSHIFDEHCKSSLEYTLNHIAQIAGGKLIGKASMLVSEVSFDSRMPILGSKTLFVAIKTGQGNGHQYLAQLFAAGCHAFLVSEAEAVPAGASYILVDDTLTALQTWAAYHRGSLSATVLGITGSSGKTTVKEWLSQLIAPGKLVFKSPKSYNSQLGVALSVLLATPAHEIAIFEAGISKPGEMKALQGMIRPQIGLITNIGAAHEANFSSIEAKLQEKLGLFETAQTILFCQDHSFVAQVLKERFAGKNLISWGFHQEASLRIIERNNHEIHFSFRGANYHVPLPFFDSYHFENVMHCLLAALVLGEPLQSVVAQLQTIKSLPMRLEMKQGKFDTLLVNDSYSADEHSLKVALHYLSSVAGEQSKSAIISEFDDQLVRQSDYQRIFTDFALQYHLHSLVLIGENLQSVQPPIDGLEVLHFPSGQAFLDTYNAAHFAGQALLVKGARKFKLEQIIQSFQAKSHRTQLEINLAVLRENFHQIKQLLLPQTQVMVMLKALGYGAGTFEIARLLQGIGAAYLAVAYIDEGVMLRQKGIKLPIMVLNPDEEGFVNLLLHKLEPEVYSFGLLSALLHFVRQQTPGEPLPIHININSGMNRLGFDGHEVEKLGRLLKENSQWLSVASVFTHLAGSDETAHDAFTMQQKERFDKACAQLQQHISTPFFRHVANTAGAIRNLGLQYNMVRLGIGFYGIDPSQTHTSKLRLAFRWVTRISQVRQVAMGESVGYSRRWFAGRNSLIATIPIGYADGFSRALSNGAGGVYIHGKWAPVVGSVCMDMLMVDVTEVEAKEGDEVVIFENPEQLERICKALHTIPYEVMATISDRVKRIYLED
ncbi:bifunctional UDP-N-acetylmuramoyl-tripeptide:D-alanyl-D-alanine ligase/alanine racemase [bacterium]|nr:bifunctional UDP-N-acetylmuramoyl-tripeptide:D-alanyl-D-alanine ligase/alanine racemase [bacterium]